MLVYRLCKTKRAKDLSGEGARRAGGRWNSRGNKILYTAEHISLAVLEVTVHISSIALKLPHSCTTIQIPDDKELYKVIDLSVLPMGWSNYPAPDFLKDIGDQFLGEQEYLGLIVPSAISPKERNYLLNPNHTRYKEVVVVDSENFPIDPRIKQDN